MNEKEKKEFYIAMCKCCLIADSMKGCAVCPFNIGLGERVTQADPMPVLTEQAERLVAVFDFA